MAQRDARESHAYVLDICYRRPSLDEKHPSVKYGVTPEQQLTHALPAFSKTRSVGNTCTNSRIAAPPEPVASRELNSNWLGRAQVAQAAPGISVCRDLGFYSKIYSKKNRIDCHYHYHTD